MRIGVSEETEPSNAIGSSLSSLPVISGPVQPLGDNPQPNHSVDSTIPPASSMQGPASATSAINGSSPISLVPSVTFAPAQALGTTTTSSASSPVHSSSPNTFQFPPAFASVASSGSSILGQLQTPTCGWNQGCGVRYPSNVFGQTNATPASSHGSVFAGVGTEQGSRYPRYAPTPDLDDSISPGKMIVSISASNSHQRKSHEELRWEDYTKGDKGGFRWPTAAHTSPFNSSTVSPSLFASPSMPDHPQRTTFGPKHGNMTGYTIPTAVPRPHEQPASVSSPASACTACGATSSSSPSSVHLGFNGIPNPPLPATSLPGLFFPTYGSCPLLFGTPNLAAYATTTPTPAVQAYPMMFGTSFTSQGPTVTQAVQSYPMMFGTSFTSQGPAATQAVQAYPMMFGTTNLAAQGTTTAQAYPVQGLILLPFAAMNLQ